MPRVHLSLSKSKKKTREGKRVFWGFSPRLVSQAPTFILGGKRRPFPTLAVKKLRNLCQNNIKFRDRLYRWFLWWFDELIEDLPRLCTYCVVSWLIICKILYFFGLS